MGKGEATAVALGFLIHVFSTGQSYSGKEAAGIGQAWTPEQLASDNADGLGQDAYGAPPCLQTPGLAIPGEKGLRHP